MVTRPDEVVQFKIRLPEATRLKLVAEAEAADRSLNGEILWRLDLSLTPEWEELVAKVEARKQLEQSFLETLRQNPAAMEMLKQNPAAVRKALRQFTDDLVKENRQLEDQLDKLDDLKQQTDEINKLFKDGLPKKGKD
jgi:hypothetical protein